MHWVWCLLLTGGLVIQAEDTSEATFQKARVSLSAGDYAAAEQGFQNVLRSMPNHIGALGNLGVVYSRTNRTANAIAVYRRALELSPQNQGLRLNLGLIYLKEDRHADALPLFTRAVAADPSNPQFRELLATCQVYTGHVDEAVTSLEKLRQEVPGEAGVSYLLGIGYLKQQRKEKAYAALQEFLLSTSSPQQSNFLRGKAYYDGALFTQAAECFEKVLESDPQFPGAHLELGKTFISLGRNQDAEVQLVSALQADAQDPQVHYFLGGLLIEQNRFVEAQRHLAQAREQKPDFWGTYYYLGKLQLKLKKSAEAIPLFQKAAELNPAEPSSYYLLASALRLSGKDEESKRALKEFERRRILDH